MSTHHLLGDLPLPRGLIWADEFEWTPVATEQRWSTTGAQLLHVGVRQAGRPITLQADDDAGWMRRSVLDALRQLAADPAATYTLTLADGRSHTVRFAPGDSPIEAHPVARPELPGPDHPYIATVRLIEV